MPDLPSVKTLGVDSTSKCTTESALDDFSWRAVAEASARSIIQVIYDHGKMFVTDPREVSALWEVSTQQPVGIFVEPALPSAVGIGEEHLHPTRLLDAAELGKLLTVV